MCLNDNAYALAALNLNLVNSAATYYPPEYYETWMQLPCPPKMYRYHNKCTGITAGQHI